MKMATITIVVISVLLGIISYPYFQTVELRIGLQYKREQYLNTLTAAANILGVPADESKTLHDLLSERKKQFGWLPPKLEAASILRLPWSTPTDEIIQKALIVQQALDNENAIDPRFPGRDPVMQFKLFKRIHGFVRPS